MKVTISPAVQAMRDSYAHLSQEQQEIFLKGYYLGSKEVESLKGLIARMYNEFIRAAENTSPCVSEDNWQKFQKQNNL